MSQSPKALKNRKIYIQKFREEWLTDPELIPWLKEVPKRNGGSGVECTFCECYITMKHSDIKRHAKTTKHINNSLGKQALSPSQQALATKPYKGQLLKISKPVQKPITDVAEGDGVNYSVHQVQPCEFVVLQNESSPVVSIKNSSLVDSAGSKEFDAFEDLMKFDKTNSNIPYTYLEEKYYEFYNIIDKNKFRYKCKLCPPTKFVRATRKSTFALKSHIRYKHYDCYDEFLECLKSNRKRRTKRIRNPYPYSGKYFKFNRILSTSGKKIFECKLCPLVNTFANVRTVKCPRNNPYNLEKHIRNHHNSYANEFRELVNDYAKSLSTQTKSCEQSGQSTDPTEKDEVSEKCENSNITEKQITTGTKIKLPQTRSKKIDLQISDDDEAMFNDDDRDPDFHPRSPGSPDTIGVEGSDTEPRSRGSPDPVNHISVHRNTHNSSDLINKLSTSKEFASPIVYQPSPDQELHEFVPLFDNVLVQKDETFTPILMKNGILLPPTYKAKVVAVGRGIRNDSGEIIPLEVSVGDGVIIPESGGAVIELDRKEYLLYKESDLLAKFKSR